MEQILEIHLQSSIVCLHKKYKVIMYTKQPRTNMKIRYERWQCVGCDKVVRVLEKTESFYIPYWLNIRTTSCNPTSKKPGFDTFACSTECLKKASDSIQEHIKDDFKYPISSRRDNQATICDQCGKVVITDLLHPLCGGNSPLEGWEDRETAKGIFVDFCCDSCEGNYSEKPEEAIFFDTKLDARWKKEILLEVIEFPNFREAFDGVTKAQLLAAG
jgi:hypothetical protein